MSQEILFRGIFSGIYGFMFSWVVFSRYDTEVGSESTNREGQKYLPYLPSILLPFCLLMLVIIGPINVGIAGTAKLTISMCFSIFLHISIYYILLIMILPLLRKYISARACAMLWIIPNYLYIVYYSHMKLPSPKFVLHAPGNIVWIFFFIWIIGFIAVLTWKTIEHLIFRRNVLRDSREVFIPSTLAIWDKVIKEAQIKKPRFKLVISPNVKTPLSIGLFKSNIRVVLPEHDYSAEELELIFRHEIIHIAREDSWSKYFLVFCTATCWFNPLMWIAMKKSAEDMELSCDETVLLNTDDVTKKKYASLLLDIAGDERGFTTCLSASAETMRYRLKNIIKPSKRHSGAIIVGLVFFFLCMTNGYVALAYGGKSGTELIYKNRYYSEYRLDYVSMSDDKYNRNYDIDDETAFHEYLGGLTLSELTGNYTYSDSVTKISYLMDTPEGTLVIILHDDIARIIPLYGEDTKTEQYYIRDGIDWEYINSIIIPHPALNLHFTKEGDPYGEDFSARLDKLWKTRDGVKDMAYDSGYPAEENHGLFGYDPFDEVVFDFSMDLAAPCSVLIETWDRSDSYTVTQENLSEPFVLELSSDTAHYTIYASFKEESGTVYDAEFRFDIGNLGE